MLGLHDTPTYVCACLQLELYPSCSSKVTSPSLVEAGANATVSKPFLDNLCLTFPFPPGHRDQGDRVPPLGGGGARGRTQRRRLARPRRRQGQPQDAGKDRQDSCRGRWRWSSMARKISEERVGERCRVYQTAGRSST